MINNDEKIYTVNDKIDSRTKIYKIEKEQVLLQHNLEIKFLRLFNKEKSYTAQNLNQNNYFKYPRVPAK